MTNTERERQSLSPEHARLIGIVSEHLWYARRYPERLAEVALRMGISDIAALAAVIADEVVETFTLKERSDDS